MAKVTSLQGKATGKVGSVIYAINAGQQIAREYQPIVANPSTEGQVENRSKLKLLSQLSAAYKGSIAIRRDGLKSARNLFIGENYANVAISGDVANVNLNRVQLTKSNVGMIGFNADRSSGTKIAVELNESAAANFDKVIYSAFRKDANGNLIALGSAVINKDANSGEFAGELPYTTDAVVIYAYGMKINDAKANAAFGNMIAPSAEQVAKLIATSSEVASGTTLSKTAGLTMLVGENTADSDDVEHCSVSVIKSGNGSVSGGGRYVAGQTAVVTAIPDEQATFIAWKRNNASGEVVSTSPSYSFEVEEDIVLCAVFEGGVTPTYTISASVSPNNSGTITGAGVKEEGSTCTLVATPETGYRFVRWEENGQSVSTNATYSFAVTGARTLVAVFEERPQTLFDNVTIGGNAWNQNGQAVTNGDTIAGSYSGAQTRIGFTNEQPVVGRACEILGTARTITGGNFSFTAGSLPAGQVYLVAGEWDTDNEVLNVEGIYEYTGMVNS